MQVELLADFAVWWTYPAVIYLVTGVSCDLDT